jgi:hypothetical protein
MGHRRSRLDTLADVSCGDMGHPIHPFGHEEHLRHRSGEASPSTSDSRRGLDIPANRKGSWGCAECGIMYPKSKLLEIHARSTKHKAYRCSRAPVCTKIFSGRTGLSRHEAAHLALMKHACSKCSARFERRDHCEEHDDFCVASLPLPITHPVSTQASGSEPKAAAPISTPGREQQTRNDADDIPTQFAYGDQHDMNTVAHVWFPPGLLSSPPPADLQNYHTSNRAPTDTTSADADSGSQTEPTPTHTTQNNLHVDVSHQMHVNPLTPERIPWEAHEPQQPAQLHTCTHGGCFQRFEDHLEVQNHIREHHKSQPTEDDQCDHYTDFSNLDVAPARSQKRAQSHACDLCPKRFTRAFTLREHSRAHTGARPFLCYICDKPFSRQHDRMRHQLRHYSSKFFKCDGILKSGASWGCGRKFTRREAWRRHSRSKSGQICTKPFFDEEAATRKEAWLKEHGKAPVATTSSAVTVQSNTNAPFVIPAALLQQYPALADLDLTSLHVASTPPDEEAYGDGSAFDE